MADDDIYTDEEIGAEQEIESEEKKGFPKSLVTRLLKWVAIGLATIIFIVSCSVFYHENYEQGNRRTHSTGGFRGHDGENPHLLPGSPSKRSGREPPIPPLLR